MSLTKQYLIIFFIWIVCSVMAFVVYSFEYGCIELVKPREMMFKESLQPIDYCPD